MFELQHTIQCSHCPWRVDVNPNKDIPNGYSREMHENLSETIAKSIDAIVNFDKPLKMMACHESDVGYEYPCIGWLNHQIGVGNNIQLRLHMLHCSNLHEVVLCGEQHQRFADTVPKPDGTSVSRFKNDYFNREDYDPADHDLYY